MYKIIDTVSYEGWDMMRKTVVIIFLIIMISSISLSDSYDDIVISLGKDLSEEQRIQILDLFGVDESVRAVYVTNQEERKYLGQYVDEKKIGTKAISCAYVRKLSNNQGINVTTYNINWVTKDMYANALITAGVKDAEVKVAAPVSVSGTAALTGIIKAFEDVSGKSIGEKEKQIASEEISKTGELGQEIGKDNASQLIKEIKEEIVGRNIKDEENIREIIINVSQKLEINLTEKQINEILELMKNISSLNLNLKDIKGQLKNISDKVNEIAKENKEVKSLLQRILDFLKRIFEGLSTWLNNLKT